VTGIVEQTKSFDLLKFFLIVDFEI